MMTTVSIIVPVYNGEKYLARCLTSISEAADMSCEIIIVDDGSSDATKEISSSFSSSSTLRIKYIYQQHNGLVQAYKTGIVNSKGTHIAFVDSDDTVKKEIFRQMYETALRDDSDVVICNFNRIFKNMPPKQNLSGVTGCRSKDFILNVAIPNLLYSRKGIYVSPSRWAKLFKAEILKENLHLMSDDLIADGEDIQLVFSALLDATKISFLPQPFYNYYFNDGSLSSKYNLSLKIEQLFCLNNVLLNIADSKNALTYVCDISGLFIYRLSKLMSSALKMKNLKETTDIIYELSSKISLIKACQAICEEHERFSSAMFSIATALLDKDLKQFINVISNPDIILKGN